MKQIEPCISLEFLPRLNEIIRYVNISEFSNTNSKSSSVISPLNLRQYEDSTSRSALPTGGSGDHADIPRNENSLSMYVL